MHHVTNYLNKFSRLLGEKNIILSSIPIVILLFFLFLTCSNPSGPPENGAKIDTTSHDFVWQIDTLGDGNASVFYDAAVIGENNIWAVGEIFFRDAQGNYSEPARNVARWNGNHWIFQHLVFPQYNEDCTVAFYGAPSVKAIYILNPNNILITDGGSIARWNENTFVHYPCMSHSFRNGTIRRIWGESENDFYVVGTNGMIIRYQSGNWQRLESGTELDVNDIWGEVVGGETEILAVASKKHLNEGQKLLSIKNNSVEDLPIGNLPWSLSGVWFKPGSKYYIVGDGIFYRDTLRTAVPWEGGANILTSFYSNAIRGNDLNDVFVVGAFGDVLHYNGSSWMIYPELRMNSGSLYSVSVKDDIVAAAGTVDNTATVIRGKRR
jgi:hypothetical protein